MNANANNARLLVGVFPAGGVLLEYCKRERVRMVNVKRASPAASSQQCSRKRSFLQGK